MLQTSHSKWSNLNAHAERDEKLIIVIKGWKTVPSAKSYGDNFDNFQKCMATELYFICPESALP